MGVGNIPDIDIQCSSQCCPRCILPLPYHGLVRGGLRVSCQPRILAMKVHTFSFVYNFVCLFDYRSALSSPGMSEVCV